jgi:hypothetical protein
MRRREFITLVGGAGATIDARKGTSDPDNGCQARKPQLTCDLDAAGSPGFTAVHLDRHRFSNRNH